MLVEFYQRRKAAQLIELAGSKNGDVSVHESLTRFRIIGDELRRRRQPFLFVVTQIKSRGDGIYCIGNDFIF